MNQLYSETMGLLAQASTATIQYQLFKRGPRNTYLFGRSTLNPAVSRLVGEAFALRSLPAREDIDVAEVSNNPEQSAAQVDRVGRGWAGSGDGMPQSGSASDVRWSHFDDTGIAATPPFPVDILVGDRVVEYSQLTDW